MEKGSKGDRGREGKQGPVSVVTIGCNGLHYEKTRVINDGGIHCINDFDKNILIKVIGECTLILPQSKKPEIFTNDYYVDCNTIHIMLAQKGSYFIKARDGERINEYTDAIKIGKKRYYCIMNDGTNWFITQ